MRVALLAFALLAAGCVTPDAAPAPPTGNVTAQPTPDDNATATPALPIGERMEATMEHFVLATDRTLLVMRPGDAELPATKVPETLSPGAFYESFATGISLTGWPSEPFETAWESTGDIEVKLRFTADAAAVATTPKGAGFPGVGAFMGTTERHAFFLLAGDAPDTLEAGKEYTVTVRATPPRGGLFLRAGEQLAIHPYLAYATADGRPASYVVGGPDPAGMKVPHAHFALGELRAVPLLDESGELGPNPAPSGDAHPSPVDLPFTVPPEAVYVVLEVTGAPKAGQRVDIDLSARTGSGEVVSGGFSPHAEEMVVLGPGNLAAYGRDLVAHVTCATAPTGATFTVKATAYVP